MLSGGHVVIYSKDAEADRAFLNTVLGLPDIDVGEGWLVMGLPECEIAVHPASQNAGHEFFFLVDDINAFVAEMHNRKTETDEIVDEGWGLLTRITLPGGSMIGVYQPLYIRPPRFESGS